MQGVSDEEKKRFGRDGEDLAASFLRSQGFRIRDRNFRCRQGEIDLVAERDRKIVFVEVKSRHSVDAVSPLELVPFGKQVKISKAAQNYIAKNNLHDRDCGFAVLILDSSQNEPTFEWIENAFDLAYGY